MNTYTPQRLTLALLAMGVLFAAGCQSNAVQQVKTTHYESEQCFVGINELGEIDYERFSCSLDWPNERQLSNTVMNHLAFMCFVDSTLLEPSAAIKQWFQWLASADYQPVQQVLDSAVVSRECTLSATCNQHGRLLTYTTKTYHNTWGAAHGMYDEQYFTVDVKTGNPVYLIDLVDTNQLRRVVALALHQVDANSATLENLFDEFRDAEELPLSYNFYIDATQGSIVIVYPLYAIAPYSNGIQHIVLPLDWLRQRNTLLPSASPLLQDISTVGSID